MLPARLNTCLLVAEVRTYVPLLARKLAQLRQLVSRRSRSKWSITTKTDYTHSTGLGSPTLTCSALTLATHLLFFLQALQLFPGLDSFFLAAFDGVFGDTCHATVGSCAAVLMQWIFFFHCSPSVPFLYYPLMILYYYALLSV